MKYNRRDPVDCRPMGDTKAAWFYVQEGGIVVVLSNGGQAHIRRSQLLAALAAMRPARKR